MDYNNGKIYVMRSNKTDKIYIGSTTQPLFKRFFQHKVNCCNKNLKELMTEHDDFYIELLESFPCNSKEELLKRENELIRENKELTVNIIGKSTGIKINQYVKKNGEISPIEYDKGNYNRTYYATHKEKLAEKIECECGRVYTRACKFNHFKSQKHKKLLETLGK